MPYQRHLFIMQKAVKLNGLMGQPNGIQKKC